MKRRISHTKTCHTLSEAPSNEQKRILTPIIREKQHFTYANTMLFWASTLYLVLAIKKLLTHVQFKTLWNKV